MNRFRVIASVAFILSALLYALLAFIGAMSAWSLELFWIGNWDQFWRGFFAVLVVCIFATAANEEAKL